MLSAVPLVSIVIPVRADPAALEALLARLPPVDDVEIIVACAAPIDEQTSRIRDARPDIVWVESRPGRGAQLEAGARRARGRWIWFVHADSRLPNGWLDAFRALPEQEVIGGAFRFALDSTAWQARVLERLVAWRVRWFDLPFGDQGIFVRRDVLVALGGVPPLPLMEDVELVRRMTRHGRLQYVSLPLVTSARRWEREGWWRRSAANLLMLLLYRAGVSPARLARRYYGGTEKTRC